MLSSTPRRGSSPRFAAALVVALSTLAGCAHQRGGAMLPPTGASGGDPRCAGAQDQPTALISEWSPGEKAVLEQALKRGGAVAVEHQGCSLRVLAHCKVPGSYSWQRTGPAQASVQLDDERTLFDRVPLAASALQAELRQAGRLQVSTHLAGDFRLQQQPGTQISYEGECEYATHLVTAVSVGASALLSGDGRLIRGTGDPQACSQGGESGPNPSCAAPLQLSLMRIPGRGPEEPPPGMVQVEVVSEYEGQVWDLYAGKEYVCTTPCTQWLNPRRGYLLESRGRQRDRVWVPGLGPEAEEARYGVLAATGTHHGKEVNGIVFTSLGGMGLIVAISLTAIGCTDLPDLRGMCNAGLITGAVSAPMTGLAILMLLDSAPKANVFPVFRSQPRHGQLQMTLGVAPTGLYGSF